MLVEKSCQKEVKSIYKCDRCGKSVDVKNKIGIYTQKHLSNSRKYCDLCLRCFRALERGIEKGKGNGN